MGRVHPCPYVAVITQRLGRLVRTVGPVRETLRGRSLFLSGRNISCTLERQEIKKFISISEGFKVPPPLFSSKSLFGSSFKVKRFRYIVVRKRRLC